MCTSEHTRFICTSSKINFVLKKKKKKLLRCRGDLGIGQFLQLLAAAFVGCTSPGKLPLSSSSPHGRPSPKLGPGRHLATRSCARGRIIDDCSDPPPPRLFPSFSPLSLSLSLSLSTFFVLFIVYFYAYFFLCPLFFVVLKKYHKKKKKKKHADAEPFCKSNEACAHCHMVSKNQWEPFWLATQRDPQNHCHCTGLDSIIVWTMTYQHSPDEWSCEALARNLSHDQKDPHKYQLARRSTRASAVSPHKHVLLGLHNYTSSGLLTFVQNMISRFSDRSCWELIITTTSHGTSRFVTQTCWCREKLL